ncbi:hypothetical protein C8R48DRAFT_620144, partial [Suillus tomentosus]
WFGFGLTVEAIQDNFFMPFLNVIIFFLMCWFHSSSNMKPLSELDCLINKVILIKVFDKADLQGFYAAKKVEYLDIYYGDPGDIHSLFSANDVSVKIYISTDGVMHQSLDHAPEFSDPSLFYYHPIKVTKNAFCEASAKHFHFTPFKQHYCSNSDALPQCIYSEIYTSPAMLEEYNHICSQSCKDVCTLETVAAAIMFWSDSTHLASFGTTSLWLIYLFLRISIKIYTGENVCICCISYCVYTQGSSIINNHHIFSESFTNFLT